MWTNFLNQSRLAYRRLIFRAYLLLFLVCASAIPATEFDFLLTPQLRKALLALQATDLDVCFSSKPYLSSTFLNFASSRFENTSFTSIIM
nr:MAG TPA: hypothetical protein [Caudoviricetes sp.]